MQNNILKHAEYKKEKEYKMETVFYLFLFYLLQCDLA